MPLQLRNRFSRLIEVFNSKLSLRHKYISEFLAKWNFHAIQEKQNAHNER